MSLLALYLLTLIIFLGLDYLGLTYLIRPIFERDAAHLLADTLRLAPALLFYAFFIACVTYFVTAPALSKDWPISQTFLSAALLGAMAYGTYEFTNLATLKGWTWSMVLIDFIWGTALTAVSATLATTLLA